MTNETRKLLRSAFARVRNGSTAPVLLVTLGPAETSSARVAQRVIRTVARTEDTVLLFDTFEGAGAHAAEDQRSLLLVPNAYASLNTFYFDTRLHLCGCFVHPIPRYGIACRYDRTGEPAGTEVVVATHPAPLSMAKDFLATKSGWRVVLMPSTAAAAEAVANGSADYCVTNAVAAAAYGLRFVAPPRRIVMGWSLFHAQRRRSDVVA